MCRHEMLDVVTIDGVTRGIIARNLITAVKWKTFRSCGIIMYGWIRKRFLLIY